MYSIVMISRIIFALRFLLSVEDPVCVTLNKMPKMITERRLEKVLEAGRCQYLYSVLISLCSHGVWAERPRGNGVQFPAGVRDFACLQCVQTGSGAHTASYSMGTGATSAGEVAGACT
jgi:hypothetical protein